MAEPSRPQIDHVFVLMLENRSFDHMLAFSRIPGITRAAPTASNSYLGHDYPIAPPGAPWTMPTDPPHEFADAFEQLCGPGAVHTAWAPYPDAITNSGFVAAYATSISESQPGHPTLPPKADYGDVMRCFDTPQQLPVLLRLASEFAVCDHWFSSLPGPTWPNRLFLHGASSAGWADSPSPDQLKAWYQKTDKFVFPSGVSIFDRLTAAGKSWRVYSDDDGPPLGAVPMVAALADVVYHQNTFPLSTFDADLAGDYPYSYTFIEPNYGDVLNGTFEGGSSQHPLDGITRGEQLIKSVYESIRRSALWERCMFVVLYDEHGGFYDSVAPGPATPPGDGSPNDPAINKGGFLFDRYGVRVPAVVVSPFVAKGTVASRVYDHASIPATIERLFGLDAMTGRDAAASDLLDLVTEASPRTDCPVTLPEPATPSGDAPPRPPTSPAPTTPVTHGAAHLRLAILLGNELAAAKDDTEREAARRAHAAVQTHADAHEYVAAVIRRAAERCA